MAHFLLIHGSWHAAWCWRKVAARLEAAGHRVSAPDLPGRGRAPARPALVGLERMTRAVARALPGAEKTVVVAHSRYGAVGSRLAEIAPERIARTIYLAAFMLAPGARVADAFRRDKGSALLPGLEINRLGLWDRLRPEVYREALYHDCDDDDVMLARLMLCREPLRPAITRLKLTEARYGSVPRAYIRLTDDRAVTPALQDALIEETGADRVESVNAGHSAYFSQPDALTETILKLARA